MEQTFGEMSEQTAVVRKWWHGEWEARKDSQCSFSVAIASWHVKIQIWSPGGICW